jgi:hypothetical protein
VDEAQELTDAEWQMLLLHCPVPELHHRRGTAPRPGTGSRESWQERLERIGLDPRHPARHACRRNHLRYRRQ